MSFSRQISLPGTPDEVLVDGYKNSGNLQVLGELYQRYMDLVYGVCLKYLKTPEDAQDSVMLIFEELISKLKKHEVDNFKGWLYTLARNHCLMKLRADKRQPIVKMDESFMQSTENEHLVDVLEREGQLNQLEWCIDQLPEGQKQSIQLFYLKGKCYNEIVAETGLEWSKIRSFIQNGRRNLKLCMETRLEKTIKK